MTKEDDAARNAMARGGVIPARPKGAPPRGPTPPPPLDDFLAQRKATKDPARFEFEPGTEEEIEAVVPPPPRSAEPDSLQVLADFVRMMKRQNKQVQVTMLKLIADLLD